MTDQLSFLDSDPVTRARRTDPSTSAAAARSVRNIRESQMVILQLLRGYGPSTDEEIFAILNEHEFFGRPMSISGARTRRKEMVDLGHIKDSGQRKKTKANRATIVWAAAVSSLALQEGLR